MSFYRIPLLAITLCLSLMATKVMNGDEEEKKRAKYPEHDNAFAAVFNSDGEFSPLMDDGKRVAKIKKKDLKKLKTNQLENLVLFITGEHPKMMQIDFYRPTAGIWFEKEGKIVGFMEFSFESFSRRGSVKGLSTSTDWKGVAKWFEDLGLRTNWDPELYQKMVRKDTGEKK